ncbi:hypothetical protein MRB53_034909 [Persea americana]|uniref:Uncharacterized protein n=1 Tax=Persea americana TaxID=3435 RepID=A0ACC2K357_PERAE|nr:hypothetical protein MRB53_034909 [Persea americana]
MDLTQQLEALEVATQEEEDETSSASTPTSIEIGEIQCATTEYGHLLSAAIQPGKGLLIESGELAGDLLFNLVGDPIYDESKEDTHEEEHVHDVVKQRLGDSNARYKQAADRKRREVIFELGDFVWAVMTKEHHPIGNYGKLTDRKIGPLEVLECLNNNAYRLKLPSHFKTSDLFNVKHLIPYVGDFSDDDFANSRANSFQPRGTDAMPIEEDLERQDLHPKELRRFDRAVKKKLST